MLLCPGVSGFESAFDLYTMLSPTGGTNPGNKQKRSVVKHVTSCTLLVFCDAECEWDRCASGTLSAMRMRYWICGDPPESLRVSGQD